MTEPKIDDTVKKKGHNLKFKTTVLLIFFCFLLINCSNKNNITEYHNFDKIRYDSNVTIKLNYNDDYYDILLHFFYSKGIYFINIEKNNVIVEDIPSLLFNVYNDEADYIINQLNNSPVIYNKEINCINVSYNFYFPNEEYNKNDILLKPSDEFINFLLEKIDIYYLPLYTVKENDTLSSICYSIYGHSNYEELIKYNQGLKLQNQYLVVRPGGKIRFRM
ncbi:MAG: LysM peptidoglycan-binding domain-containing protein [Treponema sp.]|nr:LysM peptidoglycan-binding domain-containing protein [Treponema sp.]